MFGELKSLGTILEDNLEGQVEVIDIGDMGPEDTIVFTFAIPDNEYEELSPAAFMQRYVAWALTAIARFCNEQGNVQVAMPPKTDQEDTEYNFFNSALPIRTRQSQAKDCQIFAIDTLLRSLNE
jgi:hypothetical protein